MVSVQHNTAVGANLHVAGPLTTVRAASTANVTLATGVENGDTLDGITLATLDRILLKNQTAGAENGVWVVAATGAPTRATDFDTAADMREGLLIRVRSGTTNANTIWQHTTTATITVGTTALTFAQVGSGTPSGSAGGDLSGTYPNPVVGQASAAFALTGDISPAQITADQNNYNPTGLSTAAVLRLNSDASRTITGLAGGADGRLVHIYNVGSFNIILADDSASSTAANRFALDGNLTLGADTGAVLVYDSTSSRWRLGGVGKTTAASGSVATDAIWDAKGDLVVGTGADTAAKLTVGANDLPVVADSAQTTGLRYGGQVGGTDFAPSGLTGAVSASRYVGATASIAPTTGTFAVGDFVITQTGKIYVCTTAGTPGTWTQVGAGGAASMTIQEVDGTPSVSATTLIFPNATLTDNGGGSVTYTPTGGSLTTASAALGADVNVTSITVFADGPSVSLAAGTWLLTGTVTCLDATTGVAWVAKLWDGTTVVSSTETFQQNTTIAATLSLSGIVSPGSTTTYKISVVNHNSTAGKIKAATPNNPSGNNASTLFAVKVA